MSESLEPARLTVTGEGRWKLRLCGWLMDGRRCQVPVGTDGGPMLLQERLCAYHRYRVGRKLYGMYTSEQRAFGEWLDGVHGAGPFPRIWDVDREQLWRLVSGELDWPAFYDWMRSLPVEG